MKPVSKQESELRSRFMSPHDVWNNTDKAVRIARRRWKKNTHRHIRRTLKKATSKEAEL